MFRYFGRLARKLGEEIKDEWLRGWNSIWMQVARAEGRPYVSSTHCTPDIRRILDKGKPYLTSEQVQPRSVGERCLEGFAECHKVGKLPA